MAMPALDAVAAEVRAWYGDYLETFTSLAAGEHTDLEVLLDYFGVPIVIITEHRYVALETADAVLSTSATLIEQLRQANYAGSTVHYLDIRPLNRRAALVEGVFSRNDREGNELERFGTTYLVAETDKRVAVHIARLHRARSRSTAEPQNEHQDPEDATLVCSAPGQLASPHKFSGHFSGQRVM